MSGTVVKEPCVTRVAVVVAMVLLAWTEAIVMRATIMVELMAEVYQARGGVSTTSGRHLRLGDIQGGRCVRGGSS
jgi:hypothetical protein